MEKVAHDSCTSEAVRDFYGAPVVVISESTSFKSKTSDTCLNSHSTANGALASINVGNLGMDGVEWKFYRDGSHG